MFGNLPQHIESLGGDVLASAPNDPAPVEGSHPSFPSQPWTASGASGDERIELKGDALAAFSANGRLAGRLPFVCDLNESFSSLQELKRPW